MDLKKGWVYVVFMLVLLPVTASAQTSLYGLPSGKPGGGVEIRGIRTDSATLVLAGNIGIGFNDGNARFSLLAGMPTEDAGGRVYLAGIEGTNLYPIESIGSEFYFTTRYQAVFIEDEVVIPTMLLGSMGLSKRLGSGNGGLKPFLGGIYERLEFVEGTDTKGVAAAFGGEAGLEYKMSWLSIIGSARFALPFKIPFKSDQIVFKVGVNFHPFTNERGQRLSVPTPPDELPPPKDTDQLSQEQRQRISAPIGSDGLPPPKETDRVTKEEDKRIPAPIPPDELPSPKGTDEVANEEGKRMPAPIPPDELPKPKETHQAAKDRPRRMSTPIPPDEPTQPPPSKETDQVTKEEDKRIPVPMPRRDVPAPKTTDQLAKEEDKRIPTPIRPHEPTSPQGMVLIPAGKFQMGTDQLTSRGKKVSAPIHLVDLDAFYIDTHEITVGEYKAFLLESGYKRLLPSTVSELSLTDDHPVVGVSWHDAMAYAKWAGKRLPTEAEWERAARGPKLSGPYPWPGLEAGSSQANYDGDRGGILPVGQYKPYGYGLYDMAGNVSEWCLDPWFSDFYQNSPRENPFAGFKTRDETIADFKSVKGARVVRGGGWRDNALGVRVEARHKADGTKGYRNVGFRCAKDAQ